MDQNVKPGSRNILYFNMCYSCFHLQRKGTEVLEVEKPV